MSYDLSYDLSYNLSYDMSYGPFIRYNLQYVLYNLFCGLFYAPSYDLSYDISYGPFIRYNLPSDLRSHRTCIIDIQMPIFRNIGSNLVFWSSGIKSDDVVAFLDFESHKDDTKIVPLHLIELEI